MRNVTPSFLLKSENIDPKEAVNLQKELRNKVITSNKFKQVKTVAGADIAILKSEKKLVCGIIVFSYPDLRIMERNREIVDETFPYVPTLLAFREAPAIIKTYARVIKKPDILILDGQGLAHPRRFGIACHVGVALDIPVIGIAKKKLYGNYEEPGKKRGSWTSLVDPSDGQVIGAVVRTKDNVKPVFVSIGHRIDLETAIKIALTCDRGYRIPEPTRQADIFVSEVKRSLK